MSEGNIPQQKLFTSLRELAGAVALSIAHMDRRYDEAQWGQSQLATYDINYMWSREETLKMEKYSDRILELIDRVDELTRSDLQGMVGALVITMVLDMKKEFQEDRLKEKLEGKSAEDLQKELDEFI